MKLGTVLTATDLNPLYCEFIPPFIKAWKTLFPEADVIVVLVAEEIPDNLKEYSHYIRLCKPINGIHTAFHAQCIRMLYPRHIERNEGVLISDMDMLPMNRYYYEKPVSNLSDNMFVAYRDVCLPSEIPMCYNIALPSTWTDVFGDNPDEETLKEWYTPVYDGKHGGKGWNTDQLILIKKFNEYSGSKIILNDRISKFKRLDRSQKIEANVELKNKIKAGFYSDYHCLRPYSTHKDVNDFIIESLPSKIEITQKNVFSFCIYGTERNYYDGLLENIQIIREHFPNFKIYIYKGECDPTWTFEGDDLIIIETKRSGAINMLYRYLPVTFVQTGFIRDADSRITERDRWCIREFLKSDKQYHIIRDHFYHKSPIMGGIFGWKTPINFELDLSPTVGYAHDMAYIEKHLYPLIKEDALIHSNIYGYHKEHVELIKLDRADKYDFVGNVIWDSKPKFEYTIGNPIQLINWLTSQDQFGIIQYITDSIGPSSVPYVHRQSLFNSAYIANFYLKDIPKCQYWLSQFEFAEISPSVYNNAQHLFKILNKKIVASFDETRVPGDDEMVIVYGNYPDWHKALPYSNKIYRHASLFFKQRHDVVEYNPAWEDIGIIYILNLEDRPDRFADVLLSLCNMRAPIHRIHHYKAKKDDLPPYVGATKNHVDCMKHFKETGKEFCLVLEDDILFIDDKELVWNSIKTFTERKYEVPICFLAISKYGERQPYDDLLSISKQRCTTSSAYFLNSKTIDCILETAEEGLLRMTSTGDHHNNCIDRYWCKLSNLMYFKTKLAFQRPSYSNLTKNVNYNLD